MKKISRSNNFPQAGLDAVPKVEITEIVSDLRTLHDMGRPKTDEEVKQRIAQYFQVCQNTSIRPGIESLCLALHISRTTLFRWSNGFDCSNERQQAIETAKSFITAYIEQVTLNGRLNPASSCFLLKNWANYKDSYSLENDIVSKGDSKPMLSTAEIMRRYQYAELPEPPEDD